MKKFILLTLYIILYLNISTAEAQGVWGRLKQKAEQVGERVIDKKVDDILNGNKRSRREVKKEQREAVPPVVVAENPEKTVIHTSHADEHKNVLVNGMILTDTLVTGVDTVYRFNTSTVSASEFVSYAMTLKGTPYSYGSADPAYGVDCSGFITHVFNHFNIQVPRRAFDFKNAEKKVKMNEAKPGDLILFSGSDIMQKTPGHMGIISSRRGKDIEFIHSSSGMTGGVKTTLLSNAYFKSRVLEVVRVF